MSITLTKITDDQHESAVDWISCLYPVGYTVTLTPQQAYRVVQRHYDGGWAQFVIDSEGVQL